MYITKCTKIYLWRNLIIGISPVSIRSRKKEKKKYDWLIEINVRPKKGDKRLKRKRKCLKPDIKI